MIDWPGCHRLALLDGQLSADCGLWQAEDAWQTVFETNNVDSLAIVNESRSSMAAFHDGCSSFGWLGIFDCLLKVIVSKRFDQDNPCIALNVDIVLKYAARCR